MADIRQNPEWAGNRDRSAPPPRFPAGPGSGDLSQPGMSPGEMAQLAAPDLAIDPTHQIAASAAKDLGIDFGEAGPPASNQVDLNENPMLSKAPGLLKTGVEEKASRLRTIHGEGSPLDVARTGGDVAVQIAKTAAGILSIPKDLIEAGKEASRAQTQPDLVTDTGETYSPRAEAEKRLAEASAQTALTMMGGRVLGAPEGGLSMGAARPPKGYSLDAPPPKETPLPPAEALQRPESDWHARVADLDANNAPDGQYRAILSTGSKDTRASGAPKDASSWRDKVVGYLNTAAGKNASEKLTRSGGGPAATLGPGGSIYRGAIHADSMEKAQAAHPGVGSENFINGFVTDKGRFVTRDEASKLVGDKASIHVNDVPPDAAAQELAAKAATDLALPLPEAPFTATPPPPEAAAAAAQGMPPPGTPPPPTAGPPPGAPPPLDPRAPAPFLEGAVNADPGPMDPKRVTEMENDLFAIKSADRGRKEVVQTQQLPRIQKALVRSFGTDAAKVDRQLYHDVENGRPIEPRAQAYYDQTIKPRRDANLAKWQELRSYNMPDLTDIVENPNQMHRMRIGKTRGMDEASGLGETVGYRGGNLSTRPSGARQRTILAMEDEAGNHKVVTEHPGGNAVFVWENGKRRTEAGGLIRTKEERTIPGAEIPGRETLAKPVVAKVEGGGLTQARYTEPKQIPDRVTQDRTTEPSLANDRFRKGSEFVDMNNKRWFIRDATTEEIHNAGVRDIKRVRVGPGQYRISYGEPVRFHESALASTIMNGLELDKALATAKFRAKWQASPEFRERSVANADATPEQRREWVTIQAPGWEGRYYEPRFAEPIIDHLTGQGYHIPIVDAASNFATGWLFKTGIGSIAHGVNEHLQRLVARGVEGNLNVVARAKTALQTFDETMNKGPIWQDYRNKGASFPSDSQHWRSVEGNILHTLGMRLAKEPGFKNWAKRHGLYSDEAGNIVEHAIGKAVFEYGDFIALQHGLELERRGFTREQAIERMNKVLPTYRIPSRIVTKGVGGRAMAQAAASPSTFQFGRFTYARFKGLSNIVEDLAGKGKSFRDRKDALGRLITVAVIMAFVAPFIDKQLQKASGDKNTHFLWGGSLGMVARAVRMADDVRAGRKNAVEGVLDSLTSSVNLGPMLKELIQQYTGRDLYNDRQFVAPTDPTMQDIAERATHIGSTFFAPTQALSDPGRYLMEPMRLSTSKPFDPRAHSRGGAKHEVLQERGRLNRLPAPVRGILKYGGVNR